jgi:hypothetical protein
MNGLSPKARALISASRPALRPTPADRERIEAALRSKLGGDALPGAEGVQLTSRVATWKITAAAALGICLLGSVALRVAQPEPAQPTLGPPAPSALPQAPVEPAAAPVLPPQPTAADPTPTPKQKPRARTSAQDQLALEVELLSRATSALHAGDASHALQTLQEHQRKFPNGSLRQERSIAKAQALCSLGRLQEGRAEIELLPANAPATLRARQRCGL